MQSFLRNTLAGFLAFSVFAMPMQALIVYTPLQTQVVNNGAIYIDVDHDGVGDFSVNLSFHRANDGLCHRGSGESWRVDARIQPLGSQNAIVDSLGYAQLLPAGTEIDANSDFENRQLIIYYYSGCPMERRISGYLGLRFVAHGGTHYAWTAVAIHVDYGRQRVELTNGGYAYESIRDHGILSGQTVGP